MPRSDWDSPPIFDEPEAPGRSPGFLYVAATPLLAAAGSLPDLRIGDFLYTGFIWIFLLLAGLILLAVELVFRRGSRVCFPWLPWGIWLIFVWSSLAWCDSVGRRNIQDAVQLSMPVLVGAIASVFVRTEAQLKRLLQMFAWALLPLAGLVVAARLGWITSPKGPIDNREGSLLAALIGGVLLAGYPPRLLASLVGWGFSLGLCVVTGSRMATLATMLVLPLNPLYRGLVTRIAAVGLLAACGLGIFYGSAFQERSFFSGKGSLDDIAQGDMNTSGRAEAWPLIWQEAWRRPLLGHGVGSVAAFVSRIWEDIYHPHNDYLRVGYELGLLGLALLLAVAGWQGLSLIVSLRGTQGPLRQALAGSFLGLLVLMITSATDNTLIYNLLFTDPLFALIGATYGVRAGAAASAGRRERGA